MFLSEKEEKITWLNSYNLLVNLFTAGVSRFFDEVSTKNAHGLAIKIKHNIWDNFVYKISKALNSFLTIFCSKIRPSVGPQDRFRHYGIVLSQLLREFVGGPKLETGQKPNFGPWKPLIYTIYCTL